MQAVRRGSVGSNGSTRNRQQDDRSSSVRQLLEEIRERIEDDKCDWLQYATRLPGSQLTRDNVFSLVEQKGEPIVFENCISHQDTPLFSPLWLLEHYGEQDLGPCVRNVETLEDLPGWTHRKYITEYLMRAPQARKHNLYARDLAVPQEWSDWFIKHYEPFFAYRSCDLLARLPKALQPLCLMAYVGCEGNRTPSHIDVMGAVGHNLMTYADPDAYAIWFISTTRDRPAVEAYLASTGRHLFHDNCVLSLQDLENSGVKWRIVVQKVGDFVFVPPDTCHQVINGGGQTVKVAWNRFTPFSLSNSIRNILPKYNQYLKGETYRTKTIVECVMRQALERAQSGEWNHDMQCELEYLIPVFEDILHDETIEPEMLQTLGISHPEVHKWIAAPFEPDPHSRTCNFCNCDIWQRWYHCPNCPDDFDLCLACVVKRRGCVHSHSLELYEYSPQEELHQVLAQVESLLLSHNGQINRPQRQRQSEWTLASVACRTVHLNGRCNPLLQCHLCPRSCLPRETAICSNAGCTQSFCHSCLFQRQGRFVYQELLKKEWLCPSCDSTCNCTKCAPRKQRRSRTKSLRCVSRAAIRNLLGTNVIQGPPIDFWYNRPPPLRRCFGPEYSSLKTLGVCDYVASAARNAQTMEVNPFGYLFEDGGDASECSDSEMNDKVSAALKSSYLTPWMPGLTDTRMALGRQFFGGPSFRANAPVLKKTTSPQRDYQKEPPKAAQSSKSLTEQEKPRKRAKAAAKKKADPDPEFSRKSSKKDLVPATRRRMRNSLKLTETIVIDDEDCDQQTIDLEAKIKPQPDFLAVDDSSATGAATSEDSARGVLIDDIFLIDPITSEEKPNIPTPESAANAEPLASTLEEIVIEDDEEDHVFMALERSKKRSRVESSPTTVSGVAFALSPSLPPWPVALMNNDDNSGPIVVKALGLNEEMTVPRSCLSFAVTDSSLKDLISSVSSKRRPDYVTPQMGWTSIRKSYTTALEEALMIETRLKYERQNLLRLQQQEPAKKMRKINPEILVQLK